MTTSVRSATLSVLVIVSLLFLCVNPLWAGKKKSGPRKDNDRAKIMQIVTEWVPALRSGSVERNVAFFIDDSLIAGPGKKEIYAGQKEIQDLLTRLLDGYKLENGSIKVQTIQVNGEWAELGAKFSATWVPKKEGIKQVEEFSHYFWLLKKQPDESWKIARFLFYPDN
jgi:ketosteroid isomerase-like protein